jgi:hypothetical protein
MCVELAQNIEKNHQKFFHMAILDKNRKCYNFEHIEELQKEIQN